ncbi:MAG: hypothetical protein ACD_75C01034G0002 [uncultured bacterium]|nr:MAG: hypothetical protein ACD_75C01034G0002 [uncultured bacterium]
MVVLDVQQTGLLLQGEKLQKIGQGKAGYRTFFTLLLQTVENGLGQPLELDRFFEKFRDPGVIDFLLDFRGGEGGHDDRRQKGIDYGNMSE